MKHKFKPNVGGTTNKDRKARGGGRADGGEKKEDQVPRSEKRVLSSSTGDPSASCIYTA